MKQKTLQYEMLFAISSSFVLSYAGMCIVWLATGLKHDIRWCCKIYIFMTILFLALLLTRAFVVSAIKVREKKNLKAYADENGYDEEYFSRVKKILRFNKFNKYNQNSLSLKLATIYTDCGKFEEGREVLGNIDFPLLSADEQNEYFNILLYGALLEKNIELANDIFKKARMYFERAVLCKDNGNVLHTLGLLYLENGAYEIAQRYFFRARMGNDINLRCECDLCLCRLFLETGRKKFAKRVCYNAVEEICCQKQGARLKQLMIDVENAYKGLGD